MLSIRTSALTLSVSSIRLMKPLSVILTFSRPWPPRGQNKSLVAWGMSDQNDFKIVSSGRKRVQYRVWSTIICGDFASERASKMPEIAHYILCLEDFNPRILPIQDRSTDQAISWVDRENNYSTFCIRHNFLDCMTSLPPHSLKHDDTTSLLKTRF